MICFPDRADRLLDAMSLLGTATRRSSKEIPEAGAEIGAAEEDVSGDPHPQEHEYDVGKHHVARS